MSVIVPSIPQSMYVQQGNGQVLVTWALVLGATSYSLQRSVDGVTYITVSSPATNSYLDTTVSTGTSYFYQVAATNTSGTSPYTTPQSIIPTLTGELSLGQLRLMAQQRADMVNSSFVKLPEWNTYINQSYFELYDILVQKFGDEYFVAPPACIGTTGAQFYNLPDGTTSFLTPTGTPFVAKPFYKLLGVDLGIGPAGNAWITLKRFNFIGRNRYVYPQLTANLAGVAGLQYRTMGNQLMFIPAPAANQLLQLWYIPRMTQLLQDTDIVDGVSGWTEYIIVDAAIKALVKEESFEQAEGLSVQKAALLERIESAAENRDAGEPDTISDTRRYSDPYGSPNGDGSFGGY